MDFSKISNTRKIIIWLLTLVFCVLFFAIALQNSNMQKVPNFSYRMLATGEWEIIGNRHPTMAEGTIIKSFLIDQKEYTLNREWVFFSFYELFNSDERIKSSFMKERLLFEASKQTIADEHDSQSRVGFRPISDVELIDYSGSQHNIALKNYSIRDTKSLTVFIYTLGWFVFFTSLYVANTGTLTLPKIVFLISSMLFGLLCFMSSSGISRVWAIDPEIYHFRYMMVVFFYKSYLLSLVFLWLIAPINLLKQSLFTRIMVVFAFAYFFSDLLQNKPVIIYSIFAISLLGYLAFIFQWIYAHQHDSVGLSVNVALKWMLFFIISCGFSNFLLNILAQSGLIGGRYATVMVFVSRTLLSIGIAGMILHDYLYKLENWWWQIWSLLIALSLSFIFINILVTLEIDLSIRTLIFSLFFSIMGYFVALSFFRITYAKEELKLFEIIVPNLFKINAKNMNPQLANDIWEDILRRIFQPKNIALRELSDIPDIKDKSLVDLAMADVLDMIYEKIGENNNVALLGNSGESMVIRAFENKIFVISHASDGLKLFGPNNVKKANMLWKIVWKTYQTNSAYLAGEVSERKRIARDLHEDLGGKLLHLSSQEGKYGNYARKTLQDLRTLTHALISEGHTFTSIVADVRYKISEYCDYENIELLYESEISDSNLSKILSAQASANFNCILNELLRNAIQNNSTTHLWVSFVANDKMCSLRVENDGFKTNPKDWVRGVGIVSAERRVNQLNGEIKWEARDKGGVICQVEWIND